MTFMSGSVSVYSKCFAQSVICKKESVLFDDHNNLIMWIIHSPPFTDEEIEALHFLEYFNNWKNKSSPTAVRL